MLCQVPNKADLVDKKKTIKNSQFAMPYLEFSGACAGCGETPYIKLITQLFGDRMMVANATGCTSIWGGSAPSMPYCKDENGRGPAWANSLFEDNAEFGLGMVAANKKIRETLDSRMNEANGRCCQATWLPRLTSGLQARTTQKLQRLLLIRLRLSSRTPICANPAVKEIAERTDFLVKRSQWVFGGDGWAYDIGYGGLDHVIASERRY